jgi:aquaporin Z
MPTQNNGRILAAELFGTLVLMLGGPGVAILLPTVGGGLLPDADASTIGGLIRLAIIAMGFGLSLMIMVAVIGPVSGCHINPAVTVGMLLARKVNGMHAVFAIIGQVIGSIAGAAIIYGIASGRDDFERGQFAANLWSGKYFGLGSTIVAEVILTALLVVVVLFITSRRMSTGSVAVIAGATLTLIHFIAIPIDNASVNPARSLGTALFADTSFEALQQLWAFIVFPLVGAVVGVIAWLVLDDARLEDTMLAEVPGMSEARDVLDKVADEAVEAVEDTID